MSEVKTTSNANYRKLLDGAGAISTGHPEAGRVYAAAYEAIKADFDAHRLRAGRGAAA